MNWSESNWAREGNNAHIIRPFNKVLASLRLRKSTVIIRMVEEEGYLSLCKLVILPSPTILNIPSFAGGHIYKQNLYFKRQIYPFTSSKRLHVPLCPRWGIFLSSAFWQSMVCLTNYSAPTSRWSRALAAFFVFCQVAWSVYEAVLCKATATLFTSNASYQFPQPSLPFYFLLLLFLYKFFSFILFIFVWQYLIGT